MPLLLLMLLGTSIASAAEPLTFQKTLQHALQYAPLLAMDLEREAISDLETRNSKAKFLPSLDLTASHGLDKRSPANPNEPWTSSLNLGVTETLYDNHRSITGYRLSLLNRDAATLTRQRSRDRVCLDTSQRFYRYSLAAKIAEVRNQQRELFRKQFATVESQYKQGLRTKKDYLRFKTQSQRAEIEHREATSSAQKTVVELAAAIGLKPDRASAYDFIPIEPKASANDLPTDGPRLESTWEYRIAQAQRDASPLETSLAERELYPRVELTTGVNYRNDGYLGSSRNFDATQNYGWNIGLTLSYNFWDWGIRNRNVQIAERRQAIQDHTFRKTALDTESEIRTLMVDLSLLKATYLETRDLKSSAEEAFSFISAEYREGRVASYDLIESLKELLDARTRFLTSGFALDEAMARYRFYQGKLYETLIHD